MQCWHLHSGAPHLRKWDQVPAETGERGLIWVANIQSEGTEIKGATDRNFSGSNLGERSPMISARPISSLLGKLLKRTRKPRPPLNPELAILKTVVNGANGDVSGTETGGFICMRRRFILYPEKSTFLQN
ncbi:hypothetical protein TNCT_91991 [Trichonephila clavata]|uniref:Uncharacterized protein n=1 Tax=Trichonephila clavata TaxID=2740835 RepID=A0A8X6FHR7_TRICU|nr:hypothetical protein TNCT_91991 [Trichonephila clavata]